MNIRLRRPRVATKVRLISHDRFVCPWCWAEHTRPGKCVCGVGTYQRERTHIVLRSEA